jgi:hypothetical protein
VHLHERDAYKAIFSFGGTLENMNPKLVTNIDTVTVPVPSCWR